MGPVVTSAVLQPYELLILGLADGIPLTRAALAVGMRHGDATREAKAFGWPDPDALAQAAADIRTDHSLETPMPPRTKRDPIPLERDVEEAMTVGAAQIEEARASVALDRDRDGTVDVGPVVVGRRLDNWETSERGIPADLDAVVDHTDQHERPATIDRALIDDTTETLQLVDRLQQPNVLDADQQARAAAVREAGDIVLGHGATVAELLAVADFIATGFVVVGGDR